jgi:hypothetical protein
MIDVSELNLLKTKPGSRTEPEVDEDVRKMDSEAHDLRRLSRANETHPSTSTLISFSPSRSKKKERSHLESPLVSGTSSTAQNEREKIHEGQHRRKSSWSLRGKRISTSFESGIISERFLVVIQGVSLTSKQHILTMPCPIAVFTSISTLICPRPPVLVSCSYGVHHARCLRHLSLLRNPSRRSENQGLRAKTHLCQETP